MEDSTKKKMGFMSIFFLGVNSIIGSGIFLLPNKAYADVGNASLLVILLNTVLALSLALCFAVSASRFDKNGSAFVYTKAAFGDFAGFEVGIFTWFIGMSSWAAETQGFLTALGSLYPYFNDPFVNKVSVVIMCTSLGLLNYSGVKFSKILNNIITVTKLLPLVLFVVVGVFFIKGAEFEPFIPGIKAGLTNGSFGAATLVIFYAFTGFDLLAVAAEDMENPKKNLPKAIITVISFCSVFYFLIMVVSIGIMGKELGDTQVPIAAATAKILGNGGFLFVTIASIIAIGGIAIALSFIAPRSASALAENDYLPKIFKKNGRFGTPGFAIMLTTIIVIFLATSGNFIFLAGLTVIARLVEYIPTALSALVLKRKNLMPAEYTMPLGPVIPIFAVCTSLWLMSQASLEKLAFGAGGLIIGAFIYLILKREQKRDSEENKK
ncbi:MAG: APC family permease [Cetobacterium sp.]|uniref:APC family permease n=2 Tax=Cetobacterium TaxID=180162 RepID=UPI00163C9838|nr:APC family permease [Cetobacterium sp. 2A]MBC2855707.1 amino acid permease [Cetobacterium sp. 2A]